MIRTLPMLLLLSAPIWTITAWTTTAWADGLAVSDAFSRATAGTAAPGVAYLTIQGGDEPDRLLDARTEAAGRVSLHTTVRDGEVMRMREVPAIDVPAHGTVRLQPGGLHLMLEGLRAPLRQGGTVPLILRFERAGERQVEAAVQAPGATAPGHAHQ